MMITSTATESDLPDLVLQRSAARGNRTSLGQEEFLALMLVQLRNQDPLKPMENGEFIGQMAQFSTVAGIAEMTKSMAQLSDTYKASQALQAAGMVGRTVLTESDGGLLKPGGELAGAVELPFSTSSATLRVYDASGLLVRELPLGAQAGGMVNFSWNGQLANGETVAPGRYRIAAAIRTPEGEIQAPTYLASEVKSVTLDGNGSNALLTTDNGSRVRLAQVRAIM